MANANISTIGRFSSQMLTYLGTQKTVNGLQGGLTNSFKYASGPTTFAPPDSASQAMLGTGVSGSYSLDDYNKTKCYFLSRGSSYLHADTMTGLIIDMASMIGVSSTSLLASVEVNGQLTLTNDAYRAFNMLRDTGNQLSKVTDINNSQSLQCRQIRS